MKDTLVSHSKIILIIPSLKPSGHFLDLLKSLRKLLRLPENEALCCDIVVVDDGSGEVYADYFQKAESLYNCAVLRHAVNLGKGRALKTAMNYCLVNYPEAIGAVTLDADGQHAPDDVLACAKTLLENPEMLVLGSRDFDYGNVPFKSRFGNKITRWICGLVCGVQVRDTQTGLRAIPREYMSALLSLQGERYEFEMNMIVECKHHSVDIIEVPIKTIYIDDNKASHFNAFRDAARIYLIFLKFIFSSLSSSVLDIVLFTVFVLALRDVSFKYYILAATASARVFSSIYNYLLNRHVVFREGSRRSAIRYYIVAVIQMVLSGVLVSLLHVLIPVSTVAFKAVVDVILFFISYYVQNRWVFVKHKNNRA